MSYLNPLRLHFAGKFQATPSTVNNDPTHFDNATFLPEYQQMGTDTQANGWWNPAGGANWRLIGCRVTAAWHGDGKPASSDDSVLSCLIADSDRQVAAKLVDLDPMQQLVSTIWGLEVRICSADGETLLRGQFESASFMDIWDRSPDVGGDLGAGAMYQSVLSNLEWVKLDQSPFLMELRDSAKDGLLSIKFNVDGYSIDYTTPEFTRGRIVGTVGPATSREPRHFVMGRQFMAIAAPTDNFFTPQGNINFCVAVVDQQAGTILLDLGNALRTTLPGGPMLNLGELSMVCEVQPQQNAAAAQRLSLGSISYTEEGWYERTAGVVALPADRSLSAEELRIITTNPLTLLPTNPGNPVPLTISEAPNGLDVRADGSVFRLNPGEQVDVRLFASRFGQPYSGAQVLLNADTGGLQGWPGLPEPGQPADAIDYPARVVSKEDGSVMVAIRGRDPGNPRKYIDGQVYGIRPVLEEVAVGKFSLDPWNFISLLLFDTFLADDPPTWLGSLQPIFQQYSNLYPVMNRFLNLADYESVCTCRQLLLLAFRLDEEHPNTMPVSRDLSASKRRAILQWLENTGADGKPRLGTPSPVQVGRATETAVTPSPITQLASKEYLKGGKAAAASRRLFLRSSAGRS